MFDNWDLGVCKNIQGFCYGWYAYRPSPPKIGKSERNTIYHFPVYYRCTLTLYLDKILRVTDTYILQIFTIYINILQTLLSFVILKKTFPLVEMLGNHSFGWQEIGKQPHPSRRSCEQGLCLFDIQDHWCVCWRLPSSAGFGRSDVRPTDLSTSHHVIACRQYTDLLLQGRWLTGYVDW